MPAVWRRSFRRVLHILPIQVALYVLNDRPSGLHSLSQLFARHAKLFGSIAHFVVLFDVDAVPVLLTALAQIVCHRGSSFGFWKYSYSRAGGIRVASAAIKEPWSRRRAGFVGFAFLMPCLEQPACLPVAPRSPR